MITTWTDIRLQPNLLRVPDLSILHIKFLLLQMFISFHCIVVSYIYCHLATFSSSALNKKQPNDNKL